MAKDQKPLPKSVVVGSIALTILGVIVVNNYRPRPADLNAVASGSLDSLLAGDAGRLWPVCRKEAEMMGMSETQFRQLVAKVGPRYRALTRDGNVQLADAKFQESGEARLNLRTPKGERFTMIVTSRLDDDGTPYIEGTVTNMIFNVALFDEKATPAPGSVSQTVAALRAHRNEFEQIGVRGMISDGNFVSWDAYFRAMDERARRIAGNR